MSIASLPIDIINYILSFEDTLYTLQFRQNTKIYYKLNWNASCLLTIHALQYVRFIYPTLPTTICNRALYTQSIQYYKSILATRRLPSIYPKSSLEQIVAYGYN